MATHGTTHDEFEDVLETARALLSCNDDTADLWEANELVNRALALRPRDSDAWILKCQVLSALDDDTAALAAVEMALCESPRSAEAFYWRSAVLSDLERFAEALKSVERSFRYLGPGDEWLLEDLYCEKATILAALGRDSEAMATYRSGLRRCPDSSILRAGLAPLQRQQRRASFTVIQGGRR
jgi:tetratricopeptide (TPR) repeat protein